MADKYPKSWDVLPEVAARMMSAPPPAEPAAQPVDAPDHGGPFQPDWVGYRQGLADGKAEATAQPVAWRYYYMREWRVTLDWQTAKTAKEEGCTVIAMIDMDDAAPAAPAPSQDDRAELLALRKQELTFVAERARDLLRCTRPRHALDDLHRDLMQWAENRRDRADLDKELAALARQKGE